MQRKHSSLFFFQNVHSTYLKSERILDTFGGCIGWKYIFDKTGLNVLSSFCRSEGDAWQGLKAPTAHHDQRSKFRQQAAPYIRPNWTTTTSSICSMKQENLVNTSAMKRKKNLAFVCIYRWSTFLNKSWVVQQKSEEPKKNQKPCWSKLEWPKFLKLL